MQLNRFTICHTVEVQTMTFLMKLCCFLSNSNSESLSNQSLEHTQKAVLD